MDRAAAELILASLFGNSTPERCETLRNAAGAVRDWGELLPALEARGLVAFFVHNLEQAGIELPATLAPTFRARANEHRNEDQRARLGLQRFLAAAARARVEVTLVGSSALRFDVHPAPLGSLGELEILVAPEHLARALVAAGEAGLLLPESSLPAWWHRRTSTALTLAPSSPVLRAIRLRCTLHHPSLCLTAREPEILARRRRVTHEGHALFLLDPLDGFFELATRTAMLAGEARLVGGRRHLLAAAGAGDHPLRLDHLLDLRTFVEARHGELAQATVLARAREWSCEPAVRAVLECLQMGLGFPPGAREWARALVQALAASSPAGKHGPEAALFRPDPIERLPLWIWPTNAYFARRSGREHSERTLRLVRARHLAAVLGAAALGALGFPLALLLSRLGRKARRAAWERAQTPERMSDVNEAWRAAARVDQMKPITPRTIALPPREEALRFPDHYKG